MASSSCGSAPAVAGSLGAGVAPAVAGPPGVWDMAKIEAEAAADPTVYAWEAHNSALKWHRKQLFVSGQQTMPLDMHAPAVAVKVVIHTPKSENFDFGVWVKVAARPGSIDHAYASAYIKHGWSGIAPAVAGPSVELGDYCLRRADGSTVLVHPRFRKHRPGCLGMVPGGDGAPVPPPTKAEPGKSDGKGTFAKQLAAAYPPMPKRPPPGSPEAEAAAKAPAVAGPPAAQQKPKPAAKPKPPPPPLPHAPAVAGATTYDA